jgi:hypothetical protein
MHSACHVNYYPNNIRYIIQNVKFQLVSVPELALHIFKGKPKC